MRLAEVSINEDSKILASRNKEEVAAILLSVIAYWYGDYGTKDMKFRFPSIKDVVNEELDFNFSDNDFYKARDYLIDLDLLKRIGSSDLKLNFDKFSDLIIKYRKMISKSLEIIEAEVVPLLEFVKSRRSSKLFKTSVKEGEEND